MSEKIINQDEARKQEIINRAIETDFLSFMPKDEKLLEGKKKIPIAEIATLGSFYQPLVNYVSSFFGQGGGSMLAMVNTKGGNLVRGNNGKLIGAVSRGNNRVGGGMAEITPIGFSPEIVSQCCMAVAMLGIEHRLNQIQKSQDEILEFIEEKDKYMLKGSLYFLLDILNNYKYNFNNEKYTETNHIKILDIKESAEQSILLYSNMIKKLVDNKAFIHIDNSVKDKLKKLQGFFKNYQIALYNYSFSSFLDVILLGNFESAFLDSIIAKIDKYSIEFRETYTMTYNKIEEYNDTAIDVMLVKEVGVAASKIGKGLSAKNKFDKVGDKFNDAAKFLNQINIDRKEEKMDQVISNRANYALPFKESIEFIKRIFNSEFDVIIGSDGIYIDDQIA